jgi:transcriptional regulator with XRE-family HTH domain/tetratricopeptide (TPR) repeat protein
MTPSRHDFGQGDGPESIGALIARVRLASGRSQLRIAELLCAAAGVPTVTRHEISRWEREERIPSSYWLRWLAVVLETPLDELERAAAVAVASRCGRNGAVELDFAPPAAAATERGRASGGAVPGLRSEATREGGASSRREPRERSERQQLRIATLRRMDDLVGGLDLTGLTGRELRSALRRLRSPGLPDQHRRRLLAAVAELAQLTCWVAADAGTPEVVRRANRIGVAAALAAGAAPLAGHLLSTLAHLSDRPEDIDGSAELARQGYRLARPRASATTRALLLHRVAFTAARAGRRRACEQALASAERAFERRDPAHDPSWVYWFNDAELTAMTGRCYAALGRPRLAEPLLRAALDDRRIRLRPWALYAAWLAAVHLDSGQVEQAAGTAQAALLTAVRVGSVRALRQVTALHPLLRGHPTVPAVREYAEFYQAARPYLPRSPRPGAAARAG